MEIFVSAGEASSDIHCARLVRELKALASAGGAVSFFGLGGDQLAAEGTELLMHNREFSVGGGPIEVLSKVPLRARFERMVEHALFAGRRPGGAILVDNGEINLRLAALLHFFGVPVVYFIPPKIWVWRASRIEKIAQHVNLVLSILPFEEPIYREWEIPFRYVGNPLVDEVPTALTQAEARRSLGLDPAHDVVAVFPGSRHNEVRYHVQLFAEGIRRFVAGLDAGTPRPAIAVPAAQAIEPGPLKEAFEAALAGTGCEVAVRKGHSHECLKAARVALVKSGTSTLEAALLGAPMVLAYHSSRSSEWFYRHVVRYRGFVGLVNLFHARSIESALGWEKPEEPLVPELILERCTPENLAHQLGRLYVDGPARARQLEALARTRQLLLPTAGGSPLEAAGRATWELFSAAATGCADSRERSLYDARV